MATRFLVHVLTASILLAIAARSDAQGTQPVQPTTPGDKTPAPPPPAAKELSQKEVDVLIERGFGRDCEEIKRPVRLWVPEIGMLVAAEKLSFVRDGRAVHFSDASIALLDEAGDHRVFHGNEIVVVAKEVASESPITYAGLPFRGVIAIEIHSKVSVVTVVPQMQSPPVTVGSKPPPDVGQPQPAPPAPPGVRPVESPQVGSQVSFKFKIDPKASLAELLPTAPKAPAKIPHWANENLAKVPELTFGEPLSKTLTKDKSMEAIAHQLAKATHLNRKKTDGFMLALIDQRTELRGLPYLMGDDCRTREEQAKVFALVADHVSSSLRQVKGQKDLADGVGFFWESLAQLNILLVNGSTKDAKLAMPKATQEHVSRATVAALMQIVMPESEHFRQTMAKYLATVPHVDATKALAKLVLFSPEDEVRAAAIEGLKVRRERDYTDILLHGFRYPLPAVSKRAAEALVKLDRQDLLANLIEVLESPDPRLPVTEKREGKEVAVVRELVRVNHHRNCMLCHAPGNTENVPDGVLTVAVPLPGEPLPKPSQGYQSTPPLSPDILVRIDMTYLRQDFSLMMPVNDAHPWPEMQRFDFLVRTRTLTAQEAAAYEPCCEVEEPGRLSPYHRSALFALRELTGRDTEPTAAAWRKLLKLPK